MRILFFGKLGEALGRELRLALPPAVTDVAQLRHLLAELYPDADLLSPRVRVCIDDAIVSDDAALCDRNEVTFLPPLSGG